jgi:hypothetical protein
VELPAFETHDMRGERLTDESLRQMAPVLVVLLRGFA